MTLIAMVIGAFLAVMVSDLIYGFILHKKSVGCLRIDNSDPDGPYLFLELKVDPKVIETNKYITLEVNTKNYISQK